MGNHKITKTSYRFYENTSWLRNIVNDFVYNFLIDWHKIEIKSKKLNFF